MESASYCCKKFSGVCFSHAHSSLFDARLDGSDCDDSEHCTLFVVEEDPRTRNFFRSSCRSMLGGEEIQTHSGDLHPVELTVASTLPEGADESFSRVNFNGDAEANALTPGNFSLSGSLVGWSGPAVKLAAPEPEVLRVIGEESERKGTNTLTSRQIEQAIKASRAQRSKR